MKRIPAAILCALLLALAFTLPSGAIELTYPLDSETPVVGSTGTFSNGITATNGIFTGNVNVTGTVRVGGAVYGELYQDVSDVIFANGASVINGTVASGTVADTRQVDQVYYQVEESGQYIIEFEFIDSLTSPIRFALIGKYVGSGGHDNKLQIYNALTSTWQNMTSDADDFPASATDQEYDFDIGGNAASFVNSSGGTSLRIVHTAASTPTHDFYIDFVSLQDLSVDLPIADTTGIVNNLTAGISNNVTFYAIKNGSIIVPTSGDYYIYAYSGFTSNSNLDVTALVQIDGSDVADSDITRTIGQAHDIGAVPWGITTHINAGEEVQVGFKTGRADGHIAIDRLRWGLRLIQPDI